MSKQLKIRWTSKAIRDLDRSVDYLLERNPDSAKRLLTDVVGKVDHLADHPEMGAVAFDADPSGQVRHLVEGPFRVFYVIKDDHVQIVRFWDARQDPRSLTFGG